MRKLSLLAIAIVMVAVAGCAAIPPEAIQLSTQVDNMIVQAKTAHLNTVEYHFDQLALMVDRFAMGDYKVAYLANLRVLMKKQDPNFVDFTAAEYDAAISKINSIKLAWLQELWNNKSNVMQSVTQFYTQLEQAHQTITNLLQSTTTVNASATQAVNNVAAGFNTAAQQLNMQLQSSTNSVNNTLNQALQKVGP